VETEKEQMGKTLHLVIAALVPLQISVVGRTSDSQFAPGQCLVCHTPVSIEYQAVPCHNGHSMAISYLSADAQAPFSYARDTSTTLALNGRPLSGCGVFPLIDFSHGLGGCGT
jgi:hypothetical protein